MRNRVTAVLALFFCAGSVWAGDSGTAARDAVFPSARFILQFGVLVFAAKIGGRLFDKWRLPQVLGELLAGVAVGPFLLGGLALPFFPNGLMSDAASIFTAQGPVYGILTLSLVVLFFLIGLDTDLRQIRRPPAGGVAAGIGGFAMSFIITLAILEKLAPVLTGKAGWHWTSPQALLTATVVSVSSVGVVARILSARLRLETPAGGVALAAAMSNNVVGIFLFTVFSGATWTTATPHHAAFSISSVTFRALTGFGLVALCGFPIARYVNGLALREKSYTGAFVVSAASLLIASGVMGALGLSVMSGAYMMGVAFSSTDLRHEIRERLDFVNVVMVPACFAALGMQIDPNLLANAHVVWATVIFAAGAALAGMAGFALPAVFAELNAAGSLRVGVASLARGQLSLALLAAVTGLAVLPSGIFLAVVVLVIASCVFAPLLTDCAFARGGNGTRKNYVVPDPVKITFRFPSHQAAMLMINRAVAIFEDDGFYAHLLNRHQMLYRISREAQVIHLQEQNGDVIFECSERERPLVNTVMMELSSGIEQSLRELQRPLDDVTLRKNIQHAAPSKAVVASIMLKNRFAVETLKPRLLATTKQGAISELVSLLYDNGLVMDRERAVQAVFEREQGLSTGLEFGLAIPHARTDAVSRLICAVGLKKEGLDFDAADGRPTRIVTLVLAPDQAATPQLQLIAQICRMLDEKGRAALLACETAEDMFSVLTAGTGSTPSALSGKTGSDLSACLRWQSISLDMAPSDQPQALTHLLALCARNGAVGAWDEIRKEIQTEPSLTPERLTGEVALFTVETPNVFSPVASLGVCAEGLLLDDGSLCRVCIMLLHPSSATEEAARVKAALARVLDAEGLAHLLAASTSKDALAILLKD